MTIIYTLCVRATQKNHNHSFVYNKQTMKALREAIKKLDVPAVENELDHIKSIIDEYGLTFGTNFTQILMKLYHCFVCINN